MKVALGTNRVVQIARSIEDDILSGRYAAGAWLKQVDLEEAYGGSRLQVRQALERLAERNIVVLVANRGYHVQRFDPERHAQLVKIRAILETAALEDVMNHASEKDLDELNGLATDFLNAVEQGTAADQERTNLAFHAGLLSHCPNRELVALVFESRGRVPASISRETTTTAFLLQSSRDHFDIVESLRRGDLPDAQRILKRHVLAGLERSFVR